MPLPILNEKLVQRASQKYKSRLSLERGGYGPHTGTQHVRRRAKRDGFGNVAKPTPRGAFSAAANLASTSNTGIPVLMDVTNEQTIDISIGSATELRDLNISRSLDELRKHCDDQWLRIRASNNTALEHRTHCPSTSSELPVRVSAAGGSAIYRNLQSSTNCSEIIVNANKSCGNSVLRKHNVGDT
ncbi:uncharacterized protein TNCV_4498481, partial [Trichonephila clavipes]